MDSEGFSEDNLTPFNGSYQFDKELFGHERGVRCGCNVGDKIISLAKSEQSPVGKNELFEYLVTGGSDGDVVVWKLTNNGDSALVSRFMAHVNTVMCVCPSVLLNDFLDMAFLESASQPNLTLLEHQLCVYTCGRDKLINRFNLAGKKLLTLEGHDDVVCSLHELTDPSKLVSGSWDGTAIVWNVLSGIQEYRIKSDKYKYSVYVNSLTSGEVLTAMQNGDLCVWKGTELVNSKKLHEDAVRAVSFRHGYLTCSNDCTVKVHSESLQPVLTMGFHEGFVYDARHSNLFDVAFSASEDKTVRVWNLSDGSLLQTLSLESSVWQVVETQYNGIATIELSGKVALWSLKPGKAEVQPERKRVSMGVHKVQALPTASIPVADSRRPENILDMTLFKKFNCEKAKELLLKYNEEKQTLAEREVLYFNEFFKAGPANIREGYDFTWVLKMLEWPPQERLPVFDVIKAAALHMLTEQLFKTRNNGSRILFCANEALKGSDNPQLLAVSLQMFSNLLYPSVSRTVMFRQYESIFESVFVVATNRSKMTQQPLSVFCQNLAIASVHNKEVKVLESLVHCMAESLKVCKEALRSDDFAWVGPVAHKHFKTLEMLMDNFTVQMMEVGFKYGLRSLLESLVTELDEKKITDSSTLKSVQFVLDALKT